MTQPTSWTPSAEAALARLDGRLFATTTETAALLGYDPRTLRKGIEGGDIPAVRAGATFRVPVSWIREQARLEASGAPGAA
ncbi:MAG: helix-turn-helix domain-containing protein [Streptosporangiaceae bacterium]